MNDIKNQRIMRDMDSGRDIWGDYQILDEIARDENVSQRDLSLRVGMALGRTNQVVKRLVRKGLIKTQQINAKRVAYYLTPQGFSEKLRLVMEYAHITINLFSRVRELINHRLIELQRDHGLSTAAILGTGELAEAVYLSIQETGLELVAVYERPKTRDHWFGCHVYDLDRPAPVRADVIMVTEMEALGADRAAVEKLARHTVELREILSNQLASFASRVAEEDPKRRQRASMGS